MATGCPCWQSVSCPLGLPVGSCSQHVPTGKDPMTLGDSGQPPGRHEGAGPGEKLAQGCTDPWLVRQRHLLCSLSTPPRDSVGHQARVLGEVKVLPSELCKETGCAEPPPQRAPAGGVSTDVPVSLHMQGLGASILRSLSRGAARGGVGSFPSHSVPGPCGRAGCGLDPFTSPNVIIPLGRGVGAGLKGGAVPTLGRQVSG